MYTWSRASYLKHFPKTYPPMLATCGCVTHKHNAAKTAASVVLAEVSLKISRLNFEQVLSFVTTAPCGVICKKQEIF